VHAQTRRQVFLAILLAACIPLLLLQQVTDSSTAAQSTIFRSFAASSTEQSRVYLPLVMRGGAAWSIPIGTPTATEQLPATGTPLIPTNSPMPISTPTATGKPPATAGNVDIVNIFYDGAGIHETGEYVEIKNLDVVEIQLANWTLRDDADNIFTFPAFLIQPGQTCRVYTNEDHAEWCGFNYGSNVEIWNNSGDKATLRDASGTLVDVYIYP